MLMKFKNILINRLIFNIRFSIQISKIYLNILKLANFYAKLIRAINKLLQIKKMHQWPYALLLAHSNILYIGATMHFF